MYCRSLAVGDHLAICIGNPLLKLFRHGILTSTEPYTVVDFGESSQSTAAIRAVDLTMFIDGRSPLFRVNYKTRRSGDDTARTALEYASYKNEWGKYHVLNNNSEHFATYCVTGKKTVYNLRNYFKAQN